MTTTPTSPPLPSFIVRVVLPWCLPACLPAVCLPALPAWLDTNRQRRQLVPTVFRWEHGGRQVYITGTFNNWEKQIPMHRSGNDFTYIHTLKVCVAPCRVRVYEGECEVGGRTGKEERERERESLPRRRWNSYASTRRAANPGGCFSTRTHAIMSSSPCCV